MTLVLTDEPPDRPAWVRETLHLVTESSARGREGLLRRVAQATDQVLLGGTDDNWGLGQIAVHLLLTERGVALIALGLAKGEPAVRTGQPRPAASGVSREGIATLAKAVADALSQVRANYPSAPDMAPVARHPYYGDLNTIGWLLTLPNHYAGHLDAFDRGTPSAL